MKQKLRKGLFMISDCKFVTEDGTQIVMDKIIRITVNGKTYPTEDISWDKIYEEVRKIKEELKNDYVEGTNRYESIQRGRSEEFIGEIQDERN